MLLEKIRQLYGAFDANDANTFNTLFDQISTMIDNDNREKVDSNRERLIETFINRDKTYEERLSGHDDKLRKLREQISLLKRRPIKRTPKKKSIPRILATPKCPNCGRMLYRYGKTDDDGRQRYHCSHRRKGGGCGTVFVTDKDGELQKGTR